MLFVTEDMGRLVAWGHDEYWAANSIFLVVVLKKGKVFSCITLNTNWPQTVPEAPVGTLTWLFFLLLSSWKAGLLWQGGSSGTWHRDLGLCEWTPRGWWENGRKEQRGSVGQQLYRKLTRERFSRARKNVSHAHRNISMSSNVLALSLCLAQTHICRVTLVCSLSPAGSFTCSNEYHAF